MEKVCHAVSHVIFLMRSGYQPAQPPLNPLTVRTVSSITCKFSCARGDDPLTKDPKEQNNLFLVPCSAVHADNAIIFLTGLQI
jgi:hypothetical protein